MSVRRLYIWVALVALICLPACTKTVAYGYDSLYYTGPDGTSLCRIPQAYTLPAEHGKLPLMIPYKGEWKASLENGEEWAFLDGTQMAGSGYVRLMYTTNAGPERELMLVISCENGESVGIAVHQNEKP